VPILNLVASKAGAKLELLFNKPPSGKYRTFLVKKWSKVLSAALAYCAGDCLIFIVSC
jgi:hypothetical protein